VEEAKYCQNIWALVILEKEYIAVDAIRSSQLFENSLIGLETAAGRKLGQQAIFKK